MPTDVPFTSRHFDLHLLTDGVYAVINSEEGWAICNAGIIDLGDRTLVYDAFTSPQAADDLRQAAEYLTGRPVSLLINSHYHNDHIWGNQAFDQDVTIISTAKTRQLIISEGAAEIKWYTETAQARLDELQTQYDQASDNELRRQLRLAIADYQAVVAALPILKVRLPNLTFTGEVTLYGPRRSARLMPFENAHCASDTLLYLPEDGVIFMEDILFIDCHPYLAEGNLQVIQHILAEAKKLQPGIVVPGHGPLGNITHLDLLDGYIDCVKDLAHQALNQGLTEAEIAKIPIPAEYQHYIFPIFFTSNLQSMVKRARGT